jgi:anti-anti-sigma regulatory factor
VRIIATNVLDLQQAHTQGSAQAGILLQALARISSRGGNLTRADENVSDARSGRRDEPQWRKTDPG